MKLRAIAGWIWLLLAAAGAWGSCDKDPGEGPASLTPPELKRTPVVLATSGGEVRVDAEVVITMVEQARGLMYREELGELEGMLFVYRRDEMRSFWMKNTLIPLDMIFIDSDRRVVGIVENAEPKTLESRSVPVASQYVLEVNGGWSERHGVGPGTGVSFPELHY